MLIFRRKYFIYPEIQRPLIVLFTASFCVLILIQAAAFYGSIIWLKSLAQFDLNLVIDFRIIEVWKKMLFVIIVLSSILNLALSVFVTLFISNKFAGPLYRLEKELDLFLNGEKKELSVNFRKNDYLHQLANKINQILKVKNS